MSQLLPPDGELINAGEAFATDRHKAGDPGASDWCSSIDFGRYMELRAVYGKSHEQAKYEVQTWLRTQLPTLPALPARVPKGNEHGALRVDGFNFIDEDGQAWLWAGYTSFALYKRFLDGENIDGVVSEAIECGANVLRVFLEFGGTGWPMEFIPDRYGAAFYDRLGHFTDYLAAHGVRVEFTVFTGAPTADDRQERYLRIGKSLAGRWNVFLELMNEDHIDPFQFSKPDGVLSSRGSRTGNGACPLPGWDYHTYHVRRDYPKMLADSTLIELMEGYSGYAGTHGPTVSDEPIGADETDQPGRRSTNPQLFKALAVSTAATCAGATFHSTNGILSLPLGPIQKQCAEAFYRGLYAGFVR